MDALEGIKKLASDVNSAASTCKEYAETIEMAAAAARPFISILETDAARLHDLGFERLLNDAGVQAIAGVIPYVSAFIAVCKLGGLFGDDSSERKTVAAINSVKGDISRLATLIGLQHRYVDEHITENRVADHVDGIAGKMNQLWLDIRNNRISDFVQYAKDNDLHRHVFYTSLGALTPFDTAPEWHTLPVPAAYYSNPWTGALVPKPEPDGSWWCYTYALPALIYVLNCTLVVQNLTHPEDTKAVLLERPKPLENLKKIREKMAMGIRRIPMPNVLHAFEAAFWQRGLQPNATRYRAEFIVAPGIDMWGGIESMSKCMADKLRQWHWWDQCDCVYGAVDVYSGLSATGRFTFPDALFNEVGASFQAIEADHDAYAPLGPERYADVTLESPPRDPFEKFVALHKLRTAKKEKQLKRDMGLPTLDATIAHLSALVGEKYEKPNDYDWSLREIADAVGFRGGRLSLWHVGQAINQIMFGEKRGRVSIKEIISAI